MTLVVLSRYIPEKHRALYLVLWTFRKVVMSCFLMSCAWFFPAQYPGLAHPVDERSQVMSYS